LKVSHSAKLNSTKSLLEIPILGLILVLAAYLRIINLDGFFIYDYDEGVYSESARMIVKGYLPHVDFFSSQPPHFILCIAAFFGLFGMNIVVARLFIVVASLIAIASAYLIARRIEDFKAGLVAAFVLSISPYFLRQSRSVMSEVPSISLALLGIWLFFEAFKHKDNRYLLLSGLVVCLGAMMKLNVGLVAPIILVLLIARKDFSGAAFFILGCIIPLPILPLFGLGKVIDQMVIFHFFKPATGTWQDHWARIHEMLAMDMGLTVTAFIGAALCIVKKRLDSKFIVALTASFFVFFLYYTAFFKHQAVILLPLLAIMSGVGLAAPINLGLKMVSKKNDAEKVDKTNEKKLRKEILAILITANLIPSVFYCVGATRPSVIKYNLAVISPRDNPLFLDAVGIIRAYADSSDYIITDQQILAFFADRDVPPDLVDTSYMRISSGYLDSETVIKLAEEYRVKVIVLWTNRLKRLTVFADYVKLNFQLVKDYGGGREIYVRYCWLSR